MNRSILTDARDLDWSAARQAAERIVRICQDAPFMAPELLDSLREKIQLVCMELDQIVVVVALHITPPVATP